MNISKKNIIKKTLKWGAILIFLLLFALISLMHLAVRFIHPEPTEILGKSGVTINEGVIQTDDQLIELISTGNADSETIILFIHGAPGSWADFSEYMSDSTLGKMSFMISYDRPGYSKLSDEYMSVDDQVDVANAIINQFPDKKIMLVGYSYGGPIAAVLAGKYPERIRSILLLAPVIDPYHEKIFWFNPILNSNAVSWLIPQPFNCFVLRS